MAKIFSSSYNIKSFSPLKYFLPKRYLEKDMTVKNLWVTVLAILLVSISLSGVWQNTYGQASPGNWEFFPTPTRNPVEPRWGSYKDKIR